MFLHSILKKKNNICSLPDNMCLLVEPDFLTYTSKLPSVPVTNMRHACGQRRKTGHKWPRCERVELNECEAKCCWQKDASWIKFSKMYKGWKNKCRPFWWNECSVKKLWHFSHLSLGAAKLTYISDSTLRVKAALQTCFVLSMLCKTTSCSCRWMETYRIQRKNMRVWRWACVLAFCQGMCAGYYIPPVSRLIINITAHVVTCSIFTTIFHSLPRDLSLAHKQILPGHRFTVPA